MTISKINIAICFNNESEAQNLGLKLKALSPEIHFITAPTFDGFLKSIAAVEKIDYFIIEETFKECEASDFIEKLKVSQRYKKSLIAVFCANQRILDQKFFDYNLNYVFDVKTDINAIHDGLERSILKSLTPIIPKNFNILAVDDEPAVLELISMHVKDLGHAHIDLCQGVLDAKRLLKDKDYDMLLLDWNLTDGSCMDIMDYIKKNPLSSRTKNALVMVITGRNDVDDIMTLLRYGIKDTLIKPFDFYEFEEKISYALEKHAKKPKP